MLGTVLCHHFQSVASLANFLPDAEVINVESYTERERGKVKIEPNGVHTDKIERCNPPWPFYFPCQLAVTAHQKGLIYNLPPNLFRVFLGSWCEKRRDCIVYFLPVRLCLWKMFIKVHAALVVVDWILRFTCGGDTLPSSEFNLFILAKNVSKSARLWF